MLQSKNYYKVVTFYNLFGKDIHKYMLVFTPLAHEKHLHLYLFSSHSLHDCFELSMWDPAVWCLVGFY